MQLLYLPLTLVSEIVYGCSLFILSVIVSRPNCQLIWDQHWHLLATIKFLYQLGRYAVPCVSTIWSCTS